MNYKIVAILLSSSAFIYPLHIPKQALQKRLVFARNLQALKEQKYQDALAVTVNGSSSEIKKYIETHPYKKNRYANIIMIPGTLSVEDIQAILNTPGNNLSEEEKQTILDAARQAEAKEHPFTQEKSNSSQQETQDSKEQNDSQGSMQKSNSPSSEQSQEENSDSE